MARPLKRSLLAALMVALLTAPGAHAVKADPTGQALKQSLKRLVKLDGGPPGAIAIVQRAGDRRRVFKAGFGNVMPTERPHPTDRMRIASVAKAFSGAVALQLVEEGRITLDTTVTERIPDLPSAWAGVTLRDLLGHKSGIPDFSKDPDFQAFVGQNPQGYLSPRQLLDFVRDEPLLFPPGTTYQYSNSDNIVVALMAEAATGTAYESLLATYVYAPLGMANTSLPVDSSISEPFIHGYDVEPGLPPDDVSNLFSAAYSWASGGIVSTPADLNRFIRGYVGGGLISGDERTEQFQFFPGGGSEPPGPGENSAGLALFKYRTPCGTVFGHTGNTPGYTQFASASRNGQSSATVAINAQILPESDPGVFPALQKSWQRAVCTALARGR